MARGDLRATGLKPVGASFIQKAALVSMPGASAYFLGGVVSYTLPGMLTVLGDATERDPGDRGACEPFARFLADATTAKHEATWAVCETGDSDRVATMERFAAHALDTLATKIRAA